MSFASLPGELRNRIYSLTLISEFTICVHLDKYPARGFSGCSRSDTCSWPRRYRQHSALRKLSLMNRRIRLEARSFFFANNRFQAFVPADGDKQAGFPLFIKFLKNIGEDGRANISSLTCFCRTDVTDKFLGLNPARQFFQLLGQCINLKHLNFTTYVEYLCFDNPTILKRYLCGRGQMAASAASTFLNTVTSLPKLESLEITCGPSIASYALRAEFNESELVISLVDFLEENRINDFAEGLGKLLKRRLQSRGVEVAVLGTCPVEAPLYARRYWLFIRAGGEVHIRPRRIAVI